MANGFNYASSHEWSNLGQGAPEVGEIPNGPRRPSTIPVPVESLEYAPTTGVKGTHVFIPRFSPGRLSFKKKLFVRPWQISTMTPIGKTKSANTRTRTSV